MSIKIIRSQELITSKWQGGSTTQLAIYPEDSSYREQNFIFRLSTAKVEIAESTFTKLPGVSRIIMILDGVLQLEHKEHYSKTLHKFDTDSFPGDWDTISYGRATDFNLMTIGKTTGSLQSKVLQTNESHIEMLFTQSSAIGYYLLCGAIEANYNSIKYTLDKGDLILVSQEEQPKQISIKALAYSEIIVPAIKGIVRK